MITIPQMRSAVAMAKERWSAVWRQLSRGSFEPPAELQGPALAVLAEAARRCQTATMTSKEAADMLDAVMTSAAETGRLDGLFVDDPGGARVAAANMSTFLRLCGLALCS